MVYMKEKVEVKAVRVFKGKQEGTIPGTGPKGLLVFRVNKTMKVPRVSEGRTVEFPIYTTSKSCSSFPLSTLLNPAALEVLAFHLACAENICVYTENCAKTAEQTCSKLLNGFNFNTEAILDSSSPNIEIVAKIDRTGSVIYQQEDYDELGEVDEEEVEEEQGEEEEEKEEEEDVREVEKEGEEEEGMYSEVSAVTEVQMLDSNTAEAAGSICLDSKFSVGMNAATLPCKHMFHRDCILNWIARTRTRSLCGLTCEATV
ncbi:hypothetical protein RJ639_012204 [Escallonia herrerae]|uniref:RING-type domain-containing protein n=1 Tax=Escallonia herrerae TaxID=1293975 RepID=A0AA88VMS2_9ASTE|nr:hypothetical protein RJ639_012204 [Escallonia herrerae]